MQQFLFAHPARLQKKLSYFMPLALEEKSHPGVRDGCDCLWQSLAFSERKVVES